MRTIVTGACGFIGSHLVERALADGHEVIGIDRLTDYYDPRIKRSNIAAALENDRFQLHEINLATDPLDEVCAEADVIWHLAGQPGVRLSWSDHFAAYDSDNIAATQRLLESVRRVSPDGQTRFVYASSSSIYGNATSYPTTEDLLPMPHSPYGVTKLAAEHLTTAYGANWGIPTTSLRYFTVYGPRQRPDMATHRLIEAALGGHAFPMFGDGSQVRTFTYVGDIVAATYRAGLEPLAPATVMNVAGGESVSLSGLIETVERLVGAPIALDRQDAAPGDATRTGGSTERATELLGWSANTSLEEGVKAQIAWHRSSRALLDNL